MDRWQYLIVLGACLLITAPLEIFGAGVYRQPVRLLWEKQRPRPNHEDRDQQWP